MLKSTLAALLLASSLTACHDRVIAVAPPADVARPGTMMVTGTATLDVSPDCADLTMTLSADSLKPSTATATATAKEDALVANLKLLGVAESDIKLSLVNLEPIYDQTPDGWQVKVRTYRAQITVTATTHDFGKVSALMEAGANAGATSMSSAFRRSDLAALKTKVRDMALAAAKAKAKQTADGLGVTLGRVVSVSENAGGMMWNATYFPQANAREADTAHVALGGTMQPLTLEISIGYELDRNA